MAQANGPSSFSDPGLKWLAGLFEEVGRGEVDLAGRQAAGTAERSGRPPPTPAAESAAAGGSGGQEFQYQYQSLAASFSRAWFGQEADDGEDTSDSGSGSESCSGRTPQPHVNVRGPGAYSSLLDSAAAACRHGTPANTPPAPPPPDAAAAAATSPCLSPDRRRTPGTLRQTSGSHILVTFAGDAVDASWMRTLGAGHIELKERGSPSTPEQRKPASPAAVNLETREATVYYREKILQAQQSRLQPATSGRVPPNTNAQSTGCAAEEVSSSCRATPTPTPTPTMHGNAPPNPPNAASGSELAQEAGSLLQASSEGGDASLHDPKRIIPLCAAGRVLWLLSDDVIGSPAYEAAVRTAQQLQPLAAQRQPPAAGVAQSSGKEGVVGNTEAGSSGPASGSSDSVSSRTPGNGLPDDLRSSSATHDAEVAVADGMMARLAADFRARSSSVACDGDSRGSSNPELSSPESLSSKLTRKMSSFRVGFEALFNGVRGSRRPEDDAAAIAAASAEQLLSDSAPLSETKGPARFILVEANRRRFEAMLLHKNSLADHLPDSYLAALQTLGARTAA